MSKIVDIVITKETVSDDHYKITEISFNQGTFVKKGTVVGAFETSKADIEIISPSDGYIFYNCRVGNNVMVGFLFGCVSHQPTIDESYFNAEIQSSAFQNSLIIPGDFRISNPARKIIQEHSIDLSVFAGKKIIETKDVVEYLDSRNDKLSNVTGNVRDVNSINSYVVIVGGGNHSKVCADIIRQTHLYNIAGIVYTKFAPKENILGIPTIGGLDELENIFKTKAAIAAVGIGGLTDPRERWALFARLKKIGFSLPNLIHPRAMIEPSASLGEGNHIMAGAVIGSCSRIENNCIVNSNAVVSHDCILENNVHITPGAILAGTVKVGKNTIIGMGTSVYYGVKIGDDVLITNGQHLFKDIESKTVIK